MYVLFRKAFDIVGKVIMDLQLSQITRDERLQPRVLLDEEVAEDYAESLKAGLAMPPVIVFREGKTFWLADGFHRVRGHEIAGVKTVRADVREGSFRTALLFAVGANQKHGLRRTTADKRKAVLTMLRDAEWGLWSNRRIADQCGVSPGLVDKLRHELEGVGGAYKRQLPRSEVEYPADLPEESVLAWSLLTREERRDFTRDWPAMAEEERAELLAAVQADADDLDENAGAVNDATDDDPPHCRNGSHRSSGNSHWLALAERKAVEAQQALDCWEPGPNAPVSAQRDLDAARTGLADVLLRVRRLR
jgi:ParB-like chromosome segregation protein Spo0J